MWGQSTRKKNKELQWECNHPSTLRLFSSEFVFGRQYWTNNCIVVQQGGPVRWALGLLVQLTLWLALFPRPAIFKGCSCFPDKHGLCVIVEEWRTCMYVCACVCMYVCAWTVLKLGLCLSKLNFLHRDPASFCFFVTYKSWQYQPLSQC